MATEWSEFIPPGKEPEVVELAGKWKHGWIPLDATATSSKMKGKTGGKQWWSGKSSGGGARRVAGKGRKRKAAAASDPMAAMHAQMAKQKPESTKTITDRARKTGSFDRPGQPVTGGKKKVLPRSALRSNQYGQNAFSPGWDEGKAANAGRDNIPARVLADPNFNADTYKPPSRKTDKVLFRKVPGQKPAPKGKRYVADMRKHNPSRADAAKATGTNAPSNPSTYPRTIQPGKITIKSGGWNESPDVSGFGKAHGWNLPEGHQPRKEQIEVARKALAKKLGVPQSQIKKSVGAMGFFHGNDTYVPNSSGGFTKRAPRPGKA